ANVGRENAVGVKDKNETGHMRIAPDVDVTKPTIHNRLLKGRNSKIHDGPSVISGLIGALSCRPRIQGRSWNTLQLAEPNANRSQDRWRFPIIVNLKLENPSRRIMRSAPGHIGPFDFATVGQQPPSGPPQSEREDSNKCCSDSGCGITTFIEKHEKTIGADTRLRLEKASEFGQAIFGLFLGLLALPIGY